MPDYFPEDNTPKPSDNEMRSLQKIVELEGGAGGGGGGGDAPANATYITRQPEGGLTNEFALSTLATGLLTVTTGTGALTVDVTKSGNDYTFPGAVIVPTGAAATPSLRFSGTTTGFYKDVSDSVIFTSASTPSMMFAPTAIILPSASELRWVSTADPVAGTADVTLKRGAASILHLVGSAATNGLLRVGDGAAATPSFSFITGTGNAGMYLHASGQPAFSSSGTAVLRLLQGQLNMVSNGLIGWEDGAANTLGGTFDTFLRRESIGIISQRNGATAQEFHHYTTFTDGSNYRRLRVGNDALQLQAAGTGVGATELNIGTTFAGGGINFQFGSGSTSFRISSAGHVLFGTDNLYDIGASGATRPRNVYVADTVAVGNNITTPVLTISSTGLLQWSSRSGLKAPADSQITLLNNAGTGFSLLQFGGVTSSFPAWKRTTTTLTARLADDSADTQVVGAFFTSSAAASNALEATNAAGGLTVGSGGSMVFSTRSQLRSSADGVVELFNNAANSFTRLSYGNLTYQAVGSGTPEGAVTAPVGSVFMRTNGGAGTTLYIKESGAGNTGWVAVQSASGAAAGAAGDIQVSNGSGGFTAEAAFNYNTGTNVLSLGDGTNFSRLKNNGAGILEMVDSTTKQELRLYYSTTDNRRAEIKFDDTTGGASGPLSPALKIAYRADTAATDLGIYLASQSSGSIEFHPNNIPLVWMVGNTTTNPDEAFIAIDEGGHQGSEAVQAAGIRRIGKYSATLNFPVIGAGGVQDLTITGCRGVKDGDICVVTPFKAAFTNGPSTSYTAWVSTDSTAGNADGVITVRAKGAATDNPDSATFTVMVYRLT